jgi:hypothetical protein
MADNDEGKQQELVALNGRVNSCERSVNELLKRVAVLADAATWAELPSPITRIHSGDIYQLEHLTPRMERCEEVLHQLRQCVLRIEKSPAKRGLADAVMKLELRLDRIDSRPEFIPIGQAAALAKVHRSTIKRWRLTYGTLSADDVQILPNGRWLVRCAAVQRLAVGRDDT